MHTLIASIIVFGLIIFVHELGHFLQARIVGIRVEEFALGMGPKVLSTQKGETVYSLRALPLGGFCRMAGQAGEGGYKVSSVYDPGRFDQKPVWARMSVVLAGPIMNFALAVLLFFAVFGFFGIPQDYTAEIGEVMVGSPAESVGLQEGDRVIAINGMQVNSWSEMVEIIGRHPDEKLTMEIKRKSTVSTVEVTPQYDPESQRALIGITPKGRFIWQRIGIVAGFKEALLQTWQIIVLTLESLIGMIRGTVSAEGVAGPVGIISLIGESARFGFFSVLNLTALISVNLGLLNLLPIPALDGSHMLFMLIEAVRGKPINPEKENLVHLLGFVVLMGLMLLITYKDILRLFS